MDLGEKPRTLALRAIGAAVVVTLYIVLFAGLHALPRHDAFAFMLVLAASWYVLKPLDARPAFVVLAVICVALSCGAVTHLWSTGHEGRSAILLGIYPYSDSGQFYSDTQRLLAGLPFEMASRRPLHAALTTALLHVTGNDLRIVLMTYAVAMGFGTAFAASEARRFGGASAGFVVFLLGAFFQRRFAGFVATEALGYPLAALAFGLLLRAAGENRQRARITNFVAGVLALSLALLARAGPMLVVPAVLVWGTLQARALRGRAVLASAGLGGAALAYGMNRWIASHTSSGGAWADLPPILYGALHRDDFTRMFVDHPEVLSLPPSARFSVMMDIVGRAALADPSSVLKAAFASVGCWLALPHGLFSYVWNNPDDHVLEDGALLQRLVHEVGYAGPVMHWARTLGLYSVVNALTMGACAAVVVVAFVVGLVRLVKMRRAPIASLVLFVMAGLLVSLPFTPPWITEACQSQAAILPFVAVVVGFAFQRRAVTMVVAPSPSPEGSSRAPVIVLATAVLLGGAGIALVVARPERYPLEACSSERFVGRADPSTRLVVAEHGEGASMDTVARNVAFLRKHNASYVQAIEAEVRAGRALALVYDACAGTARLAVTDPDVLPAGDATVRAFTYRPTADPMVVTVSSSGPVR
ncbi:hypothetical protein [Labilithrix luteola]|uniref:hypothetical protein n=1 Tax=Labilithrix luteola TaxID=1391654 RepID=UPI0011BA9629|nr:hypothetical protein [Labilithrix luteola]